MEQNTLHLRPSLFWDVDVQTIDLKTQGLRDRTHHASGALGRISSHDAVLRQRDRETNGAERPLVRQGHAGVLQRHF